VRRQVEVGHTKAREVASTIAFDVEETLAVVAWPRAGGLNGGIVDREGGNALRIGAAANREKKQGKEVNERIRNDLGL